MSPVNGLLLLHLTVIVAATAALGLRGLSQRMRWAKRHELRINRGMLALCLALPLVTFLPSNRANTIFVPVAKIMAGESDLGANALASEQAGVSGPIVAVGAARWPVGLFDGALFLCVGLSLVCGAFVLLWDFRRLMRLLGSAHPVRRIGRVTVAVTADLSIPVSFFFMRAWVLVPEELVADAEKFKVSVLHELQHHRQRDTLQVYAMAVLKALVFFNPLIWVWERVLSEVQELACDETLVDQRKIEPREYVRGLIAIAENAVRRNEGFACATGLIFSSDRHTLSRRIESMLQTPRKTSKWFALTAGLLATGLLTATALAASRLVRDHRVSTAQAEKMAEVARQGSDFPIVVNPEVVHQLNRWLGTDQGRQFVRDSLQRLQTLMPTIEAKQRKYHAPPELAAVGMVESGYRNLPQAENASWGAGVWMFITSTAQNFGLQVDPQVDQRLDVDLETDAAMRYLAANHLRFKDWQLAILAYNVGERSLQSAIDKTGSRDAWDLLRAGLKTDRDYLPRVMAAVLIIKNPEVLND